MCIVLDKEHCTMFGTGEEVPSSVAMKLRQWKKKTFKHASRSLSRTKNEDALNTWNLIEMVVLHNNYHYNSY